LHKPIAIETYGK